MIVGIIALISALLFGGNTYEYFLVDSLDKGVKKHVTEVDRRKEILTELKSKKKEVKVFYKQRAKSKKEFGRLLRDIHSDNEKLETLYASQLESLEKHQELVIKTRLETLAKITQEEWDQIVSLSEHKVKKEKAQLEKKESKGKLKDPLARLKKSIDAVSLDPQQKTNILKSLADYEAEIHKIQKALLSRNVMDQKTIRNYSASSEELNEVANELNSYRQQAFDSLLKFRSTIQQNSAEADATKILKSLIKTLI